MSFGPQKRTKCYTLPGGLCGVVDGEDVVAVHADGGHAVGGAAHGDAVALVLLRGRGADGVAVVPGIREREGQTSAGIKEGHICR